MTRVLIIRTDAIGDAILWSGALERLRGLFLDATIGVLCRKSVAPLYRHCPYVDDVVPIEYDDARFTESQRDGAIDLANRWKPDLLLNPIRSKHPHAESIVEGIHAGRRVCIESDTANASARDIHEFQSRYDRVIPSIPEPEFGAVCELRHHAAFLRGLGDDGDEPVAPRLFLSQDDHDQAARMLHEHGVSPKDAVVLCPVGRWRNTHYPGWGDALGLAFRDSEVERVIIAVGTDDARPMIRDIQQTMVGSPVRVLDFAGKTELRTCLAIIAASRVCIGTDTFSTHAACASGVPNAVLLGGAFPGRFLPYSPLTHVAMLPLDCYGCDWKCRYERTHCVADIPPEIFAIAIRRAVDGQAAGEVCVPPAGLNPFEGRRGRFPAVSDSIPLMYHGKPCR